MEMRACQQKYFYLFFSLYVLYFTNLLRRSRIYHMIMNKLMFQKNASKNLLWLGFEMCVFDFGSNIKHLACILWAQLWSFCMCGIISQACWKRAGRAHEKRDRERTRKQSTDRQCLVVWFGVCWGWGFRLISHPVRHSWMMEHTPPQPSTLSSTLSSLHLHLWLSISSVCIYFLPLMHSWVRAIPQYPLHMSVCFSYSI